MDSVGITHKERKEVFRLVAGILHLGNIQIIESSSEHKERADILDNDEALKWASFCFRIEPKALKKSLLSRTLNAGERYVRKDQTVNEAIYNRDALAKGVYERLFLWIIKKINKAIKPKSKENTTSISILDLYGFEIYPTDNSLEQLNINYVNEKLQQQILKELQQEKEDYVMEGITSFDPFTESNITGGQTSQALLSKLKNGLLNITLTRDVKKDVTSSSPLDHSPFQLDYISINDCISTIEDHPIGIYSLLDEEDFLIGSGSDERYLFKLLTNLKGKSKSFEPSRFKGLTFSLKHFAAKVEYNVTDWVQKNKDTLFKDLIEVMSSSTSFLLREIFPEDELTNKESEFRRLQETIVKQFKRDVNTLMNKKLKGKHHYIYCIKPNDEQKPFKFDRDLVLHQVKYLGLSSISHIKQHGFFFKMKYDKFIHKYKCLSPVTWPLWSNSDIKKGCHIILSELNIDLNNCAFGRTQIFLKTPLEMSILNDKLEQIHEAVAILLQRRYREIVYKKKRRKEEIIKSQLRGLNHSIDKSIGSMVFFEHHVNQIINGTRQSRLLVLSASHLCFLDADEYEMKFSFPISCIYRLCMSRYNDGILIICMKYFGDIILDVENKQKVYQEIYSTFTSLMARSIDVFIDSSFTLEPSIFLLESNELIQKEEYQRIMKEFNSSMDLVHLNHQLSSTTTFQRKPFTVQFLKDFTISTIKIERVNQGMIVYVKPNEDIFGGKKQRRHGSFYRQFVGDSLLMKHTDFMKDKIEHGEDRDVLFSDEVSKYDKTFKKRNRLMIITERSVYLMHTNFFAQSYGNYFSKTRRIPLRRIYKISVSPFSDNFFFVHVRGESDVALESVKKTEIISTLSSISKSTLSRTFEVEVTSKIYQTTKNPSITRLITIEQVQSPPTRRIEYKKPDVKIFIHQEEVFEEYSKSIMDVYCGKKSRRVMSLDLKDEPTEDQGDLLIVNEIISKDDTPNFLTEVELINPFSLSSSKKKMAITSSTIYLFGKKNIDQDNLSISIQDIEAIYCSCFCDDIFVVYCRNRSNQGDMNHSVIAYIFNSDHKTKIIQVLKEQANPAIELIIHSKIVIPYRYIFARSDAFKSSQSDDMFEQALSQTPSIESLDTSENSNTATSMTAMMECASPETPNNILNHRIIEETLLPRKDGNGTLTITFEIDRTLSVVCYIMLFHDE